ncbi:hypothetical protein Tco_1462221 [Tanacetum coccineum]
MPNTSIWIITSFENLLHQVLIDNIKDSAPIIYIPTNQLGKTGAHEEAQEPPVINDLTMVIGDDDLLYKEWTSKRPWKERKKAIKEREKDSLQLISYKEDPEMIYYGLQPGVVGLSKSELFQTISNHE